MVAGSMTQGIKIYEQGGGQWPEYLVQGDWSEAWTVDYDSGVIHTGGRPGRANYIHGRRGIPVDPVQIPTDAVIQICGDDQCRRISHTLDSGDTGLNPIDHTSASRSGAGARAFGAKRENPAGGIGE